MDFILPSPRDGLVEVNVIGVIENQAPTRHLRLHLEVSNGQIKADLSQDLAKVALIERHRGTGKIQLGLVQGFGFDTGCAIGSTVAHDSHQMIVVGTDDASMALAANELVRVGGGQIVVRQGEVIATVELPIAGLMSNERAEVVAEKAKGILDGFRACGCHLNNANMQLSLLALVVIPELRISDKGLVDVTQFEIIPLIEASN
jgi:adenine deaminase